MLRRLLALLLLSGALRAQDMQWTGTGGMTDARAYATAAPLGGGRFLVCGGEGPLLSSCEIYDHGTGIFTPTAPMSVPRSRHVAGKLGDGRVAVAGGMEETNTGLASAESFDPTGGTWSALPPMEYARIYAAAVGLNDGRFLVCGGRMGQTKLSTAEIYDPNTGAWTTLDMTRARVYPTATLLSDGRALVAGGDSDGGVTNTCEIFDPAAGAFAATGSMAMGKWMHTATLLPDGTVLCAGGMAASMGYMKGAQIYDPATGAWTSTDAMSVARAEHSAVFFQDRVCVAGGYGETDMMTGSRLKDDCECYYPSNPPGSRWSSGGMDMMMSSPRSAHAAFAVSNGTVVVGGFTQSMSSGATAGAEHGWIGSPLAAPSPLSPADGAGVTGPSVALDWSDVPGAAGYTAQVSRSSRMTGPLVFAADVFSSDATATGLARGTYYWRARAADGRWSGIRSFQVRNGAPVLAPIGNRTVAEDASLAFDVTATDPDGDAITLSTSTLPPGATFTSNGGSGTFSWRPDYAQSGTYPVTFTAGDGALDDSEAVTITVTNTNRAPDWNGIGDKTVAEGGSLSFTVVATDPDGDAIAYSSTPLADASLNSTTGEYLFHPAYGRNGTHGVTFTATDALGAESTQTIAITVTNTLSSPTGLSATNTVGQIALSWNPNPEGDVASYQVHRGTAAGGPYTRIASTAAANYTDNVAAGTTYYYVVKAEDTAGNVSGASNEAAKRALRRVRYEQGSAAYAGRWQDKNSGNASAGSYKQSSAKGATATFTFTGSRIVWIADRGPGRGIARVTVDGVPQASDSDLYASATQWRSEVFTKDVAYGMHTIRIEVTGTRNPSSSGDAIPADAFDVVKE